MKKELRIAICDDISVHRNMIKECLNRYSQELQIQLDMEYVEFSSGEDLLKSDEVFDVLFLDIQMDGIDGIETMERLLEKNNVWRIIFISSYDELMIETFSIKTLGFIRKPIKYDAVKKWMNIVIKELIKAKVIDFDTVNGKVSVDTEDILYFQTYGNNVLAITVDEIYEFKGNLKKWEDELLRYDFIRVHRCYLVNMAHIEKMHTVILVKGKKDEIPVGRSYKKNIENVYRTYRLKQVLERM